MAHRDDTHTDTRARPDHRERQPEATRSGSQYGRYALILGAVVVVVGILFAIFAGPAETPSAAPSETGVDVPVETPQDGDGAATIETDGAADPAAPGAGTETGDAVDNDELLQQQ